MPKNQGFQRLKKPRKTTFLLVMKVGEKLKNIFLEAAMNYSKMSNSEKAKANDKIREKCQRNYETSSKN